MRTITAHRFVEPGDNHLQVGVVIEGLAALLALIAFIGAICGLLTWALVHLVTAFLS